MPQQMNVPLIGLSITFKLLSLMLVVVLFVVLLSCRVVLCSDDRCLVAPLPALVDVFPLIDCACLTGTELIRNSGFSARGGKASGSPMGEEEVENKKLSTPGVRTHTFRATNHKLLFKLSRRSPWRTVLRQLFIHNQNYETDS
jgi:hypothetical protein